MKHFIEECMKSAPSNAIAIHNILNNKGFDTYFIGGALRDCYINKSKNKNYTIKDWDLSTQARHEDMKVIFNKLLRLNENGRIVSKKGKAELLIPNIETTGVSLNNQIFEVTPMHIKKDKEVVFVDDIIQDLSKRDFTINAMAYSPKHGLITNFKNNEGEVVDGLKDIDNGIIKTVSNPTNTFKVDRFRMIRAILFANRFDFEIDEKTLESLVDNIFEVNEINKGKLSVAFEKLICGEITSKIEYLKTTGLLQALCVDFNYLYADEFIKSLKNLNNLDSCVEYYDKLKFLYEDFSNKELLLELFKEFGVNKELLYKLKLDSNKE